MKKQGEVCIAVQKNYRLYSKPWNSNGYHFQDFNKGRRLSIFNIFFQNQKDDDDLITLEEYILENNLPAKKVVSFVAKNISALWIDNDDYDSSTDEDIYEKAKNLRLVRGQDIQKFLNLLRKNKECLRGISEGGVIVYEKGLIKPTGSAGFVPSVPTSRVTYPDAIYRDTDMTTEMVSAGEPVVIHGSTREEKAYPTAFNIIKKIPQKNMQIFFAIEYFVETKRQMRIQRSMASFM